MLIGIVSEMANSTELSLATTEASTNVNSSITMVTTEELLTTIQDQPAQGSSKYFPYYDEIYCATMVILWVTGVVGNGLVVSRVICDKKLHSPTFAVVASLACADLMFLVTRIPFEIVDTFYSGLSYGATFCKIYMYLIQVVAYSESFHLVLLAVVRYYQLVHPLAAHTALRTKKAVIYSVMLWLFLLVSLSPVLVYASSTVYYGQVSCIIKASQEGLTAFFTSYSVFCYFLPLSILIVFHVVKAKKVIAASKSLSSSNKRQVSMAVVTVLVLFGVLLAPVHVSNLLRIYGVLGPPKSYFEQGLNFLFRLMAYSNSVINPVVYALCAKNIRKSVKKMCSGCFSIFRRRKTWPPAVQSVSTGSSSAI